MTRGMIGLCLLSSLLGCAGQKANTNPDRPEFLAHTQPQEAVYLPRGGQGAGGSIAAAGPAPSTPVWSVRAGQNLSDIIREWGVQANRTVVWQTAHDWPIVVDDSALRERSPQADATRTDGLPGLGGGSRAAGRATAQGWTSPSRV